MSNPVCVICHNMSSYLLTKDGYHLYKCNYCSLVFVQPQPDHKEISNLYSTKTGYQVNKLLDLSLLDERKNDLEVINKLLQHKKRGKILDIGCSNGQFLFSAKKRGFKTFGIEVNKGTAKSAQNNGLKVHIGTIESAKFRVGSFDFVFLGDVIEHVTNPRKFLEKSVTFLKKDGLLIISTPNLDCFWSKTTYLLYRMFKIPWSSVTPPYHLFQFSFNNINMLLNQLNLKVVSSWYNPPPPLSYELWYTGYSKKYSERKDFKNLLSYATVYLIYLFFYLLNKVLSKINVKDNSMVVICQKL